MQPKRKIITFANTAETAPDPVAANDRIRFRDLTFVPELREKTLKWDNGTNWVRALPPIQGSSYQWMMRVEIHQAPDGQGERLPTFCHPKSFERGARSPFDEAYEWFRKHAKEELYSREKNPQGLKLNTKSQGVAWVIHTGKEPGEKLGLFYASLYDGSWGGGPGLGYKIWQEANQVDTEPNSPTFEQRVHADITAPQEGRLILIEKHKPESGDKYASYVVRIGKSAAPVDKYTEELSDEEHEMLRPLEEVFYRPSEEEQSQILKDYIGSKSFKTIFGDGSATGMPQEHDAAASSEPAEPTSTSEPNHDDESDDENDEPNVDEKKDAPKAEPEAEPEPTPAAEPKAAAEPEPEKKTEAKAEAKAKAEPAAAEEVEFLPITEVSAKLGTKVGVEELLTNYNKIQPRYRNTLLEVAKEMKIDLSKYPDVDSE